MARQENDPLPLVVVDLEAEFIGRAPGSCRDLVERCAPGAREIQAADVVQQLEAARAHRQVVLLVVNCLGGYFAQALDIVATIQGLRESGVHVVVEVSGQAASAAALVILPASHVVIHPRGRVLIHREGPPAPGDAPKAAAPSTLEKVLAEPEMQEMRPRVNHQTISFGMLKAWTFASGDQIVSWLNSECTIIGAAEAVRLGFADEVGSSSRALEVALAYAGGEAVRSPRREALEALGRGDKSMT
jgi:ATP-dependent protease ClpP protease subunit